MRSVTLPAELAAQARRDGRVGGVPRVVSVLGLGHHVPAGVVLNGPIAERLGVDDEWIVRRTGVRSRRCAAVGERLSELAVVAGRRALVDAGVDAVDVDVVLVASMSQDELVPNAAPLVAYGLGAGRAGAVDVGAACTGWLSGLALGVGLIEAGRAERVLLVGAEILSRLTDPDDRKTAALFGDGAGAVVLGAGGGGAVGPIVLGADGALAQAITASHVDRLIRMDGHETFQNAVRRLCEVTVAVLARAGLGLGDVDLFVFHQANGRILRAVGERLGVPVARVADYVGELGNTSAASIPLALGLLREDGRLRAGDRVLVAAIGAGFTWGAGVLWWGVG